MASSTSNVSNVTLVGDAGIPIVGLGTYKALGTDVEQAVVDAIELGYRHFDTADYYANLKDLGRAFNKLFDAKKVTRQEIFLVTKVWPSRYGEGKVVSSVQRMLKESGLEYFDLVLLHWPFVFADSDETSLPLNENGKIATGTRPITEVYKELEKVYNNKLAKSIGISNFTAKQVDDILSVANVKPVTNQVECHVYLQQQKLENHCRERGIVLTAYCPLARGGTGSGSNLFEDETLKRIAANHNKSVAQVALRFLVQRGIVIIPKSVSRARLAQNIDLFDFELSKDEMDDITKLDRNGRCVWFKNNGIDQIVGYPFNEEF